MIEAMIQTPGQASQDTQVDMYPVGSEFVDWEAIGVETYKMPAHDNAWPQNGSGNAKTLRHYIVQEATLSS